MYNKLRYSMRNLWAFGMIINKMFRSLASCLATNYVLLFLNDNDRHSYYCLDPMPLWNNILEPICLPECRTLNCYQNVHLSTAPKFKRKKCIYI